MVKFMSAPISKRTAIGIGFVMGIVAASALIIPLFALAGAISVKKAQMLLTAALVIVTSVYTFATYGDWLS